MLAHDGTISITIGRGATTLAAQDIAPTWEAFRPVRLSSGLGHWHRDQDHRDRGAHGPTKPRPDARS
jgi:hypothetical protein